MDLRFVFGNFKILREQNLFRYRTTVFEDYNVEERQSIISIYIFPSFLVSLGIKCFSIFVLRTEYLVKLTTPLVICYLFIDSQFSFILENKEIP